MKASANFTRAWSCRFEYLVKNQSRATSLVGTKCLHVAVRRVSISPEFFRSIFDPLFLIRVKPSHLLLRLGFTLRPTVNSHRGKTALSDIRVHPFRSATIRIMLLLFALGFALANGQKPKAALFQSALIRVDPR